MLLDILGFIKEFEVCDLRSSTGRVRVDLPVGVPGVLKLAGADCFLARNVDVTVSLSGKVSADLFLLSAGFVGVDVRKGEDFPLDLRSFTSGSGEVFPLAEVALLSMGDTVPAATAGALVAAPEVLRGFKLLISSGDVLPLMEEALLSTGEMEPGREESLVREFLLLAGEGEALPVMDGSLLSDALLPAGEGELRGEGGRATGSTSRRPCVTRRTWQGSCRERKCSSVSQPPPTRTIM